MSATIIIGPNTPRIKHKTIRAAQVNEIRSGNRFGKFVPKGMGSFWSFIYPYPTTGNSMAFSLYILGKATEIMTPIES